MSHIILDHKLATTFFKFIYTPEHPKDTTLYRLFKFIQPFIVPSAYIADVFTEHGLPSELLSAALATDSTLWVVFDNGANLTGEELEQAMLDASKLKIKLTTTSKSLCQQCEININDNTETFTLNYTMKCKANINRDRAINHIRCLLKSAKTQISIRDQYLQERHISDLASLLSGLNGIGIHIYTDKNGKEGIARSLKKKKINATPHSYDAKTMHDRYIQIDDKIEILLSSGFDGLFFRNKDFSYSIRLL
jgi:hypothetical protein